MAKTFSAAVGEFAKLTKRNMRYVAAESIQDVLEAAQTPQRSVEETGGSFEIGKIPVRDADLVNSLATRKNGKFGPRGADSYVTLISGFNVGDKLTFTWTAAHASRIEHGYTGVDALGREYSQQGRQFVGRNAARFSEFVENRIKEVR